MPNLQESIDKGDLCTLTQLIFDFSEVLLDLCLHTRPTTNIHYRKFCHLSWNSSWTNSPLMLSRVLLARPEAVRPAKPSPI